MFHGFGYHYKEVKFSGRWGGGLVYDALPPSSVRYCTNIKKKQEKTVHAKGTKKETTREDRIIEKERERERDRKREKERKRVMRERETRKR